MGVGVELPTLPAVIVREKHEPSLVHAPQEHHAHGRMTLLVGRCERDGSGVYLVRARSLISIKKLRNRAGRRHAASFLRMYYKQQWRAKNMNASTLPD
jgi:hypothetical protein